MKKARVAIIGTGNIGTDLLVKIQRSQSLTCTLFTGRNIDSMGMRFAANLGVPLSDKSIDAIVEDPDCCDIVFDATSASTHHIHAPILKGLSKFTIDLTPSLIGEMCIPVINLDECLQKDNVNMVTCGGQATVPIARAICDVQPNVEYLEIVASISSKSAGPGTRANIDEFTQTTKNALIRFSSIQNAKAIIILNPAEPPILMHNTIYAVAKDPDMTAIVASVRAMEKRIQEYVPGYRVVRDPVLENGRITTMIQVVGLGDYLPQYSGNLDIITCAAVRTAESYAERYILHES